MAQWFKPEVAARMSIATTARLATPSHKADGKAMTAYVQVGASVVRLPLPTSARMRGFEDALSDEVAKKLADLNQSASTFA